MSILQDYKHFDGRHYETGSVHNVLAYQGVKAPHTQKAYSEALLLGVSGGITFGYFNFHYQGYLPILPLLSRNTFDPMQTLLERLGIRQHLAHTASEDKGLQNMLAVIESGRPAIVWADFATLPYNGLEPEEAAWGMLPLVVFGHDGKQAHLADRSAVPLTVSAEMLAAARGRIKKDKFAMLSLDPPQEGKLPAAVSKGIWDCIQLFTEKPPRGTANNFGFSGMDHWADMLTNTRNKKSWARFYPPGPEMFSALSGYASFPGMHTWIEAWGDGGFERGRYADFLEEAALILEKPALKESATLFRKSHKAWRALNQLAFPEDIPQLKQARELHHKRIKLFMEQGSAATEAIQGVAKQQSALLAEVKKKFDLDEQGAAALRAAMAEQVLTIKGIEQQAIAALQNAMA
jgi:hypothetical protein